jgi:CoA:oxalate CoA-transferase
MIDLIQFEMGTPLNGVRVLDLTRVLAGPYATLILGDLGAEVIKIERPGNGDDSRAFGPFLAGESLYFMSLNRNKKSIVLDLKSENGKDVFKKLVGVSDVVIENFRPGVMDKLGLGYEVLRKINPGIIYVALSGFGQTGPYRGLPAYDMIVQAMGGIMSITGETGGSPVRVGTSIGDITAGLFTAIGVFSALRARDIIGEGQMVDIGMLDCQVAILENAIVRYFATGEIPKPLGSRHPSVVPFEAFKSKDSYVVIAIGNDNFWRKFCNLINKPDLSHDSNFETNSLRAENYTKLKAIMNQIILEKTTDEWVELLQANGIPCCAINTVDKVFHNEQVNARKMIIDVDHPTAGKVKMSGIPIKLSKTPGSIRSPPPIYAQHTKEVLCNLLEMSNEDFEELSRQGVIQYNEKT